MIFDQAEWEIRFEWGAEGIAQLAPISDVLIIVDVLSFSTCVDIVLSNGAIVFPYDARDDSLQEYARNKGAHAAEMVRTQSGGFSLCPTSLLTIPAGYKLVLPSPNGAALSLGVHAAKTLTGCLRNCCAVAEAANGWGRTVVVIAAGERWPGGFLRPCVEDLLGAGAILNCLSGSRSPEAASAVAAFEGLRSEIPAILSSCSSGKELTERGFESDVALASAYNVSSTVPLLEASAFRPLRPI